MERYYPIGIHREIINNSYVFLTASLEKALCDKIVTTLNLRLQSVKAMQEYLEDDLQIDFSAVQKFDLKIMRQYIEMGKKKGELKILLNVFSELYNTKK